MKESLLTILRDKNTGLAAFREASDQLSDLLAAQAAALVPQEPCSVQTPLGPAAGSQIVHPVALIAILRAGLAILPSFVKLFPHAPIGLFGMRRDEKTAMPVPYYENLPKLTSSHLVFLLDPMIATGGSTLHALERLEALGVHPSRTTLVSVLGSAEGVKRIKTKCPYVNIILGGEDPGLDDKKFITPGLGDFGDRYFGT